MVNMTDLEWEAAQLKMSLCPGSETRWGAPDVFHWQQIHASKDEVRGVVSAAYADLARIHNDPDLTPAAKRRKREEVVASATDKPEKLTTIDTARASVARQMNKWGDKVASVIKPAENEVDAAQHAEIRKHTASLKGRDRMQFLEQVGGDPKVAAALLSAPPFLSGLNEARAREPQGRQGQWPPPPSTN